MPSRWHTVLGCPSKPLHGRKSCRIADYHPGSVEQTEDWDSYITWLVDAQTRLQKVIVTIGGLGASNCQFSPIQAWRAIRQAASHETAK